MIAGFYWLTLKLAFWAFFSYLLRLTLIKKDYLTRLLETKFAYISAWTDKKIFDAVHKNSRTSRRVQLTTDIFY